MRSLQFSVILYYKREILPRQSADRERRFRHPKFCPPLAQPLGADHYDGGTIMMGGGRGGDKNKNRAGETERKKIRASKTLKNKFLQRLFNRENYKLK